VLQDQCDSPSFLSDFRDKLWVKLRSRDKVWTKISDRNVVLESTKYVDQYGIW